MADPKMVTLKNNSTHALLVKSDKPWDKTDPKAKQPPARKIPAGGIFKLEAEEAARIQKLLPAGRVIEWTPKKAGFDDEADPAAVKVEAKPQGKAQGGKQS